jgi:hypothetical protein
VAGKGEGVADAMGAFISRGAKGRWIPWVRVEVQPPADSERSWKTVQIETAAAKRGCPIVSAEMKWKKQQVLMDNKVLMGQFLVGAAKGRSGVRAADCLAVTAMAIGKTMASVRRRKPMGTVG